MSWPGWWHDGDWYDVLQVCHHGHIITARAESAKVNQRLSCNECGQPAIMTCPSCTKPITGALWHGSSKQWLCPAKPPSYCDSCGAPFPWTDRALSAARELVDLAKSLGPKERQALKDMLPDLIADTPQTPVAVIRMRQWLGKARPEFGRAMRELLTRAATEAVKKVLLP